MKVSEDVIYEVLKASVDKAGYDEFFNGLFKDINSIDIDVDIEITEKMAAKLRPLSRKLFEPGIATFSEIGEEEEAVWIYWELKDLHVMLHGLEKIDNDAEFELMEYTLRFDVLAGTVEGFIDGA